MHELSLAQGVVTMVVKEAERHDLARVTRIQLRVGKLRAVVPELLHTALGFLTRDTVAEGAEVHIEEVPGRARCRGCGLLFPVEELLFLCPGCGRVGGEIVEGDELMVQSFEGE